MWFVRICLDRFHFHVMLLTTFISDDNDHVVDNMKPFPEKCFRHSDIEDVANDNFSVMGSLFTGAFDHILDMIFHW